jgi:hypothetical protein
MEVGILILKGAGGEAKSREWNLRLLNGWTKTPARCRRYTVTMGGRGKIARHGG